MSYGTGTDYGAKGFGSKEDSKGGIANKKQITKEESEMLKQLKEKLRIQREMLKK